VFYEIFLLLFFLKKAKSFKSIFSIISTNTKRHNKEFRGKGYVISVGDGIVRAVGLLSVHAGEMVKFPPVMFLVWL